MTEIRLTIEVDGRKRSVLVDTPLIDPGLADFLADKTRDIVNERQEARYWELVDSHASITRAGAKDELVGYLASLGLDASKIQAHNLSGNEYEEYVLDDNGRVYTRDGVGPAKTITREWPEEADLEKIFFLNRRARGVF